MLFLEIFGAIFSIIGAYTMSLTTINNTKPLYYGFISFFVSNLSLLTFFTINGKIPIIIQMIFFFKSALFGLIKHSPNKKRDLKIVSVILFFYIIAFVYMFMNIQKIDFEILYIDTFAALIAIIGSFLLSSHNNIIRSYAFICFFIADIIFVYIGYSNAYYFFMIQSAFYLYTSVNGYRNSFK